MTDLTYAKAGEEPSPFPWGSLKVIDVTTGQEVLDVTEVNTTEGWLINLLRDADGRFYVDEKTGEAARQTVTGSFKIVAKS